MRFLFVFLFLVSFSSLSSVDDYKAKVYFGKNYVGAVSSLEEFHSFISGRFGKSLDVSIYCYQGPNALNPYKFIRSYNEHTLFTLLSIKVKYKQFKSWNIIYQTEKTKHYYYNSDCGPEFSYEILDNVLKRGNKEFSLKYPCNCKPLRKFVEESGETYIYLAGIDCTRFSKYCPFNGLDNYLNDYVLNEPDYTDYAQAIIDNNDAITDFNIGTDSIVYSDLSSSINYNFNMYQSVLDYSNREILNDIKKYHNDISSTLDLDDYIESNYKIFDILNNFNISLTNTEFFSFLRDDGLIDEISVCPTYSITLVVFGLITFDVWCDPSFGIIWYWLRFGLLMISSVVAFKVALL